MGGGCGEQLHLRHQSCLGCQLPTCEGIHTQVSMGVWGGVCAGRGVGIYRSSLAATAARESNPGPRGRTGHPFGHSGVEGGEGGVQIAQRDVHEKPVGVVAGVGKGVGRRTF